MPVVTAQRQDLTDQRASLGRIEERLDALPVTALQEGGDRWKLLETPLEVQDKHVGIAPVLRRGRARPATPTG